MQQNLALLSVTREEKMREGSGMLESIGVRGYPMWARGLARIDGDDIVLDGR